MTQKKHKGYGFKSFFVGLTLFSAFLAAGEGTLRVGVVDIQKIQAPYKQKIENHLNKIGESLRKEFSEIENQLRLEKKEIETLKTQLPTGQEKEAFAQKLQVKVQEFEQRVKETLRKEESKRNELQKSLSELEVKFSQALSTVLKDVSLEKKLDIMLPKGLTLYHTEALDYTESVAKKLSEKSEMIFSALPKVTHG